MCKQVVQVKETAMQTEGNYGNSIFSRSRTAILKVLPEKIVKLESCKGDLDETCEMFEDCDLSSIHANDSTDVASIVKSTSKDETVCGHLYAKPSKLPKRKYKPFTACASPEMFKDVEENRMFSMTPSLYKNKFITQGPSEELSESFEILIENFSNQDPDDLKQCFRTLVMIEKRSVQENFYSKMFKKQL